MKKLKVTWLANQSGVSAEVHPQVRVSLLGGTLVFQDPDSTNTVLVLPERCLVSAVEIEVSE